MNMTAGKLRGAIDAWLKKNKHPPLPDGEEE
jgi:hypothetical protein